ncbi:MAG: hypothetical protein IJO29_09655 [Oscillospiraceae bacterium]|nr:hypothetical protein [Oscillospiraceae bacterium]
MLHIKKRSLLLLLLLLPTIISSLSVLFDSLMLVLFATALILTIAVRIAVFRKYANLWVFIMTSMAAIPVNLSIIFRIKNLGIVFNDWRLINFLYYVLVYMICFSAEQISIGIATRFLVAKQSDISLD